MPRSIGFSINLSNTDNANSSTSSRANPGNLVPMANSNGDPRATIRSNTFVLDNQQQQNHQSGSNGDESLNDTSRSVEYALYNVRRARRARTPMTFNIMLDEPMEPLTSLFNENSPDSSENPVSALNTTNNLSTMSNPAVNTTPKVNYAAKKRAKLIIGKQGRESGEFIWPIDIAINQFNNQLLVSDSSNHRIQIFMEDGNFLKLFGKQGQRDAQFDCVGGIFIDSMSNIFVVDRMNHSE